MTKKKAVKKPSQDTEKLLDMLALGILNARSKRRGGVHRESLKGIADMIIDEALDDAKSVLDVLVDLGAVTLN